MAGIDKLIEVVTRHGADQLVLESKHRAMIVSGKLVRYVTAQPLTQEQIQDLVQEILPEDASRVSNSNAGREFDYESSFGAVRVRLQRRPTGTRVEVVRSTPAGGAATPSAGESMSLPRPPGFGAGESMSLPRPPGFGAGETMSLPRPPRFGGGETMSLPRPPGITARPPVTPAPLRPTSGSAAPIAPEAPAPVAAPSSAPLAGGLAVARGPLGAGPRPRPRIETLFEAMMMQRCSDLHLSVGSPPLFRKDGEITSLGEKVPLTEEQIRELVLEIAPPQNSTEFDQRHDTDFSYEMKDKARFRVNLFLDRRGLGAVFRLIPGRIPTPQELGLSKSILDLCMLPKGLVLVTGPTGSGKSTTLAAMIEHINNTRSAHIITIEDPIEFTYSNKRCLVNQREVGVHTDGFKQALRAALREDPDIVLVGEMRDLETVAIALETAETGHLVFATLHTNTASSAIDRIIDQFHTERQAQVRTMLAETLRGVIAQTLLRRRGGGLVAAYEVLLVNSAVSNLIREVKTFQVQSVIQTGRAQGMLTMNDALLDLVRSGLVDVEVALDKAPNRVELKQALERRQGRQAASPQGAPSQA